MSKITVRLLNFNDLRNLRILLQFAAGFNEVMDSTHIRKFLNKMEFNLVTSGNIINSIDKKLLINKFVFSGIDVDKNKHLFIECVKQMSDSNIKLMTKAIIGSTHVEYYNSKVSIQVCFIKGRSYQIYIHSCFNQIEIQTCRNIQEMQILIASNFSSKDTFNTA